MLRDEGSVFSGVVSMEMHARDTLPARSSLSLKSLRLRGRRAADFVWVAAKAAVERIANKDDDLGVSAARLVSIEYRRSTEEPQKSHRRKEGFDNQGQHDVRGWRIICVFSNWWWNGYEERYGCET